MRLHNYTSSSVCVSFAKIKMIFIKRVDTSLYSLKKTTSNNARIDRCISNIFCAVWPI